MHGLCTLEISESGIEVLPDSLSDVVTLKAIFITKCRKLRYVPNLRKLKKLEELDLSRTGMEEVPQGIEELINLKFLSFHRSYRMKVTSMVLNFTNIQCLLLPPQIDLRIEEVVALKHMEEFQGRLKDVSDFHQLIKSRPKLRCRITVGRYQWGFLDNHSFIRFNYLFLTMYNFTKARDEDLDLFFKANILHLVLRWCKWQSNCIVEDVSRMCNPSSLKGLRVEGGEELECLLRREQFLDGGVVVSMSISPPLAQTIFSNLKELSIGNCHEVKKPGLLLSQLPSLEEIEIVNCSEIEEVMEVGEENGTGEPIVFLHNLKRLILIDLPRLKSICNATMVCTSIHLITLRGLQEVKKLPLVFGQPNDSPPPSTLEIRVKKGEEKWWEALELGHPNLRPFLYPLFIPF